MIVTHLWEGGGHLIVRENGNRECSVTLVSTFFPGKIYVKAASSGKFTSELLISCARVSSLKSFFRCRLAWD